MPKYGTSKNFLKKIHSVKIYMKQTLFAIAAALFLTLEAFAGNRDKAPIVYLENDGAADPADKEETEPVIVPSATYMFAERDTCLLYLDIYEPAAEENGGATAVMADGSAVGRGKPTIIFVFGGGFISGRRDSPHYLPWFKTLTDMGFRLVSIDYRLGLKGATAVGVGQVNILDNAIHMAVEDLYSATAYLIQNAEALGIDAGNIVISGSSAGAITSLQAEYELCNRTELTSILPSDFNYAGVMSFAGGIFSRSGKLKFAETPCPLLLLHGTKDKVVNYKQVKVFNIGFFGSDKIAKRLDKFGHTYKILRYADNGHEIASTMQHTVPDQMVFIEENVMRSSGKVVDATVYDPEIQSGNMVRNRKELYSK